MKVYVVSIVAYDRSDRSELLAVIPNLEAARQYAADVNAKVAKCIGLSEEMSRKVADLLGVLQPQRDAALELFGKKLSDYQAMCAANGWNPNDGLTPKFESHNYPEYDAARKQYSVDYKSLSDGLANAVKQMGLPEWANEAGVDAKAVVEECEYIP